MTINHAANLPSADKIYLIAGVYNIGNSTTQNASRHALLQAHLERENIPFKIVEGGYRNREGIYKTEMSFLFPAGYWLNLISWFLVYKQESVLILDKLTPQGRRATLHYLDTSLPIDIGWFTEVSRDTALTNDAGYTFDPEQGTYFIASK